MITLQKINFTSRQQSDFKAYYKFMSRKDKENVLYLANKLKNISITHLNATFKGGGVAETLKHIVPLMNNLGIKTSWYVLQPDNHLFTITKKIHNQLQGMKGFLSRTERHFYLNFAQKLAEDLDEIKTDILIIHDPQPLAGVFFTKSPTVKKIWYSHIDTSIPNKYILNFLQDYIKCYDHYIFSDKNYILDGGALSQTTVFRPAIDPLSHKNKNIPKNLAEKIVKSYGVDTTRPLIAQLARFDSWKDPLGVIEAYKIAKKRIPDLQLALISQMATDDPDGKIVYHEIKKYRDNDKDIHLIINPKKNDIVVNAFQTFSWVIIQKSLREGFGLSVTEAMWKKKAVIGGDTIGISSQIDHGVNGIIVKNIVDCSSSIVKLINNPNLRKKLGEQAKQKVTRYFLLPRLLKDYLTLIKNLYYL